MITRALIATLDRAESPRAIQATTWALERVTGQRTIDLVERKGDGTGIGQEWYRQEGFHRIAGQYGSQSYSGKTITIDSALESTSVLACAKIISEDVGGAPFYPCERNKTGESVEVAYANSLYRVLADLPNDNMSSREFREALTARACLGIDGFAKIERSKETGQVVMLWPYTNASVTPAYNRQNQLFYKVKEGNSAEKDVKREEVFHLKGWTLDGISGDDILQRARHAIGLGLSADEYAGRFFSHDASPGIILSRPAGTALEPGQIQKIKDAWKRWHQGLTRAHEPAILQDGMTATRMDPDHQKLQLHESRKFQVVEIARIYRMPLHKLAELDRSTNNNIEHQGKEYVRHTLTPWFCRWRDAVHRCLLTPDERYWNNGRPRMFADFDTEDLESADLTAQTAQFVSLLQNGVYSINQVLGFLNMNPIGPEGDEHRVQMQMVDVAQAARAALTAPQVTQ